MVIDLFATLDRDAEGGETSAIRTDQLRNKRLTSHGIYGYWESDVYGTRGPHSLFGSLVGILAEQAIPYDDGQYLARAPAQRTDSVGTTCHAHVRTANISATVLG